MDSSINSGLGFTVYPNVVVRVNVLRVNVLRVNVVRVN
jgi:hypothetical protein